jgi:NAD(P)-dependent dehydrogenase (short-subunit alcohol dehydrogenase family)
LSSPVDGQSAGGSGRRRGSILITGCSTGIGYHCAHGMKERGWQVFVTARKGDDIKRLRDEGFDTSFLEYADEDSITATVDHVLQQTGGRLDVLFNNGAYSQPGAIEDLTMAALREQFDANFFGWHDLVRRIIPVMRAQGSGRIVQNSSILGFIALPMRGAYTSSKFAIEGYTDTLRIELEGSGIHVSSIQPGPIESKIGENAIRAIHRHIDIEGSVHREVYRRRLAALEKGGNTFGQLGPEAVLKALVHACESRRPKPHYHVTNPTRLMAMLRRILPGRALHAVLTRAKS